MSSECWEIDTGTLDNLRVWRVIPPSKSITNHHTALYLTKGCLPLICALRVRLPWLNLFLFVSLGGWLVTIVYTQQGSLEVLQVTGSLLLLILLCCLIVVCFRLCCENLTVTKSLPGFCRESMVYRDCVHYQWCGVAAATAFHHSGCHTGYCTVALGRDPTVPIVSWVPVVDPLLVSGRL